MAHIGPRAFLRLRRIVNRRSRTAVSLFSGVGLSDLGYEMAGFKFLVQVELDEERAALGKHNFPDSKWIVGDVRRKKLSIVRSYRRATKRPLDLLVATPPCQGMSSSNPGRGRRLTGEAAAHLAKNRLLLAVTPVARALMPRVIVIENVRQLLTLHAQTGRGETRVVETFRRGLPGYTVLEGVVNAADYGVAQDRRRAIIVAVRNDDPMCFFLRRVQASPWPSASHSQDGLGGRKRWESVRRWLELMRYGRLDASSEKAARGRHPLHCVPFYDAERYSLVADIPPYSGLSAYDNDRCPTCGGRGIQRSLAVCPGCSNLLHNRPIVATRGRARLIKGFGSSYRRMSADRPAPTVTTNSSHIGSDFKIHPWENRVLSALECADLQTVPRCYDWSSVLDDGRVYFVRNVVGEALPVYFTFLHGLVLHELMRGGLRDEAPVRRRLVRGLPTGSRSVTRKRAALGST